MSTDRPLGPEPAPERAHACGETTQKPLPHVYPDDRPFWEGTRQGELRLPHCADCGEVWWPPSQVCPRCLSANIAWLRASGRGRVASWVVFHKAYYPGFAAEVPYNVAWIELEEGPRLTSNVVDVQPQELRIGLPVEVVFDRVTDEITLPRFRPRRA